MKAFILDASMALAWFFPHPEDEAATLDKRSLYDERVALVPSIWRAEVVNFIARQQNKGGISAAQAAETLHQIEQLPMGIVDDPGTGSPWQRLIPRSTDDDGTDCATWPSGRAWSQLTFTDSSHGRSEDPPSARRPIPEQCSSRRRPWPSRSTAGSGR